MRKKVLLLLCFAFLLICGGGTIRAQQGVILPQAQRTQTGDTPVSSRRGVISNPDPDPNKRDTIHGARDVSTVFGAGESSIISGERVRWPFNFAVTTPVDTTGLGSTFPLGTVTNNIGQSLLIGSDWAKNAVVGIYDNDGLAAGELKNIRLEILGYTYSNTSPVVGMYNGTSRWSPNGIVNYTTLYNVNRNNIQASFVIKASDTINNSARTAPNIYRTVGTSGTAGSGTLIDKITLVTGSDYKMEQSGGVPSVIMAFGDIQTGTGTITSSNWYRSAVLKPYFNPDSMKFFVPIWNHISMNSDAAWDGTGSNVNNPASVVNQFDFWFDIATADTMYTSTRNDILKKDNNESLLYTISGNGSIGDFQSKLNDAKYIRPTTVLVSDQNILDSIVIGDVEWYAAFLASTALADTVIGPFFYAPVGTCGHFSGWASYSRTPVTFDTIPFGTKASGRYVDAAVRILDNADVCVTGSVSDKTGTPLSFLYAGDEEKTNALLVLPGFENDNDDRSNFRLKIGGNADMVHYQDSNFIDVSVNPLTNNYLYSNAKSTTYGLGTESPGELFPDGSNATDATVLARFEDIWLSDGTQTYTEVAGLDWNYAHPRDPLALTDPTPGALIPRNTTNASVYGVRGNYNGNANIHTLHIGTGNTPGAPGTDETQSIIEIGSATQNQDKFNIYSMGMLKNFRSGCTPVCAPLIIGIDGKAPNFFIDTDDPLTIIQDGNGTGISCCADSLVFLTAAVNNLNTAIANATGGGDLHIQSTGGIKFWDDPGTPIPLDFTLQQDNQIKILSDQGYIHIENPLNFMNADLAHLTIWAKGAPDGQRGFSLFNCPTGAVAIDKDVNINYNGGTNGSGLILIRSENDDVLLGGKFSFTNTNAQNESGELMVQAGQDVRIADDVTLNQDGQRSLLFEAQKTVAFEGAFAANLGLNGLASPDVLKNGNLTIKAGYPNFLPNADVTNPLNWGQGICVDGGFDNGKYLNRDADQPNATTGGDIWFAGDVNIKLTPESADETNVYVRAYNSIHIDADYTQTFESAQPFGGTSLIDTIMKFAETGNIMAISGATQKEVKYDFSANEWVYFLMQAGNTLGDPCGPTAACAQPYNDQWHGNILFGNKALTLNHAGVGPTLISASRDIENQVGSDFTFNYVNDALTDRTLVTAGRHIETHAPYLFNFTEDPLNAGFTGTGISANVTMQAGHQLADCKFDLCKTIETASNVGFSNYAFPDPKNIFAQDGVGHGSILAYNPITFKYNGTGQILMSALNGNIETDPYIHSQGAEINIFHGGTGLTKLEAIDIKLHDKISYIGSPNANQNGNFTMFAYDSILTRSIDYRNLSDAGSVNIYTDKMKAGIDPACIEYNIATGGPGIHQGHIVLGFGANCDNNPSQLDIISFDFTGNTNTTDANVLIKAGYAGFDNNPLTGKINTSLYANHPADVGKGYGGNITFDRMIANMALGNGTAGGYMEISTPNGNIWGKDSLTFHGINGDLVIDAGIGSVEDTIHAVRWPGFPDYTRGASDEKMLNTSVLLCCGYDLEWRTGNIMLKGGSVDFLDDGTGGTNDAGSGNVTFRTREGYIDIYDRFTASNMSGHLLMYAGSDDPAIAAKNQWGDLSIRDLQHTPNTASGSIFLYADDNVMLNYGNSNGYDWRYYFSSSMPPIYDVTDWLVWNSNPFFPSTFGSTNNECFSAFNVHVNGYMWYLNNPWKRKYHRLYRGCEPLPGLVGVQPPASCSPLTGECKTIDNGARPLTFDFSKSISGGLAVVAQNYIDMFTAFSYDGGAGTGLDAVPGMNTLKNEKVEGFGLFVKALYDLNGPQPEERRLSCFGCTPEEWTYIGFHDDARIRTQAQKSLLQAPIIEFFGHANLDAVKHSAKTKLTLKADSLIFHDSVVFIGTEFELVPHTLDPAKREDTKDYAMRLGVFNDLDGDYYRQYGSAILMTDRFTPVLELGYQRCFEPPYAPTLSPNDYSRHGGEATPRVGGDIIVAFKEGFSLPIYNSVVANHARISFLTEINGPEFEETFIRTDLLRIRNKVEFYTDPAQPTKRVGTFKMSTQYQMPSVAAAGIYPNHLHLEPGSELSIPGEDSLIVIATTTVGGFGEIHENVHVKANGILAPGYSSLMEHDCTSGHYQGMLSVHDLYMEKDAVLRISIGNNNVCYDSETGDPYSCIQADTLYVQDSVFFFGKIPMYVFSEMESIERGCYLFMIYNDHGNSAEYINNLELQTKRIGNYNLSLDKSERGRVYLCVSEDPVPPFQRYIHIHSIEGVTTDPVADLYHYVWSHDDFPFKATYADNVELDVTAIGWYSKKSVLLPGTPLSVGTYQYTIKMVTEPFDVYFDPSNRTGNATMQNTTIWSYRNTLFINVDKDDVVSIYNVTGVLYQKLEIPAGLKKLTLDKGVYMVTLKDGTVHKIVIN